MGELEHIRITAEALRAMLERRKAEQEERPPPRSMIDVQYYLWKTNVSPRYNYTANRSNQRIVDYLAGICACNRCA